jgi:hypothetical protein
VLFRYRLTDAAGTDLGPLVSRDAEWAPGATILLGAGQIWRVTAVVPEEAGTFRAYLVIERQPHTERPPAREA